MKCYQGFKLVGIKKTAGETPAVHDVKCYQGFTLVGIKKAAGETPAVHEVKCYQGFKLVGMKKAAGETPAVRKLNRRHGFTLVEMLGVVAAIGALLTISASLLNRAFSTHRAAITQLHRLHSLELMVQRWRDDVNSATQVTPGTELVIDQVDSEQVVYRLKDNTVIRTKRQGGQDVGQDSWQLPSPGTATWLIDDQGTRPLLIGTLTFNAQPIAFADVSLVARVGGGGEK